MHAVITAGDTMRRILGTLAMLAVVALAGCAAQTRSDSLTTTLKAYASTLRWGDFASAMQFVDPEARTAHPVSALDMARYQQVRVTGYDDGQGPLPSGENEVLARAGGVSRTSRSKPRSRAASTSARSRWPQLAGFAANSVAQNAHSLISVAVNS